jgi:hypothetical protein
MLMATSFAIRKEVSQALVMGDAQVLLGIGVVVPAFTMDHDPRSRQSKRKTLTRGRGDV